MADKRQKEEKFYTPQEVAKAVLKRAHELLKESSLSKSNTSHEVEAGEEPNNDEAEAPEYLANADIEDSGAHGTKTKSKKGVPGIEGADVDGDGDIDGDDAMDMADSDGDGDIDGDDAIEAQEEAVGEDLDGDGESDEPAEHKAKVNAAAGGAPKASDKQDTKETIKAATQEKPDAEAKDKKPPFAKSESGNLSVTEKAKIEKTESDLGKVVKSDKGVHTPHYGAGKKTGTSDVGARFISGVKPSEGLKDYATKEHGKKLKELKEMPKPNLPKSEDKQPSLKKFMLARKMKKAGVPTSDARQGEKMSGATPQPSPAEKIKAQPKLEMEKNKSVEKLMGISPKAGK